MRIEKTIASVVEFIPKVIFEVLQELSLKVPLTERDRHDLNLILEEAITNAIQHGNQFDMSQNVRLILEYDNDTVTIRVKDAGEGFNYQKLSESDLKEPNEKMESFGRGIFLIRKIADQVSFNETGSEVCIRKRIQSKDS